MSAIMVFSMSSQFALAAQTKSDASHNTTPGISTEKEKETLPEAEGTSNQEEKDQISEAGSEKDAAENEKKEGNDVVYNKTAITVSKVGSGITVQVTAPKGSFPEGTTASVKPVSALEGDVVFDITFTDKDGKEVQPQNGKSVSVDFTVAESSALIAEKGNIKLEVYHINDDGSADMIGSATTKGQTAKIKTKSDHFSNFLVRGTKVPAETRGSEQKVDATITDFRIEKPKGTEVGEVNKNDSFYIAMDWKVKDANAILHEGDYFDIQLPDNLRFPPGYSQPDFDLTDDNGDVIAHAHVTPGSEDSAGGTIRVTFNDKINEKYNVKGTIYLGALFNKTKTVDNEVNTFEVSVDGVPATTTVTVEKVGLPSDHALAKWGERETVDGQPINKIKWYATINYRKSDMKNCVIADTLTGDTTYIQDSFSLKEVEYNDEGGVVKTIAPVDISGKLSFGSDNKSFTLNLGDAGAKQYRLIYETTYTEEPLKNYLSLTYDGEYKLASFEYKEKDAGGTAGGDLANKIKLTKVDAEDHTIPLAGAVFQVTAPDGNTFELTTGADGTVTSGYLTQGTYTVKEITPPKGYALNDESYTLEVNASGGALKTITDKKIKTEINVTKSWNDHNNQDGKRPNAVIVHLLADGTDTGKSLTLTEAEQWKGTFPELDKYNENGEEIKYTIAEEPVSGYETVVTCDAASGYTITNKHTPEKTNISGEKIWNDNGDQDGARPDFIIINLLADGVQIDSKTVRASDNWAWDFGSLPKYKEGKEVLYTVTENAVNDYSTTYDGFDVKNTHAPGKTSITVTKTWNDRDDKDGVRPKKVTIHLLADGKDTGKTLTLSDSNDWRGSFTDLDEFKDGKKITYTVSESKVDEYTSAISGNAEEGFKVTNTHEVGPANGAKTGDDSNLALFLVLFGGSLAAILYLLYRRKKDTIHE